MVPMNVTMKKGEKNHHVHAWWFQVFDQVYTQNKFVVFNFSNQIIDLFQFFIELLFQFSYWIVISILILNCHFKFHDHIQLLLFQIFIELVFQFSWLYSFVVSILTTKTQTQLNDFITLIPRIWKEHGRFHVHIWWVGINYLSSK